VTVSSNQVGEAELRLSHRSEPLANQTVALAPGTQQFSVPLTLERRELAVITAELSGIDDTFAENNRRRVVIPPRSPVRVLVVDRQPASIQKFVSGISNFGLEVQASADLAANEELANVDVLVLSDISAGDLGDSTIASIDAFVRGGGGLLVLGGEAVFGVDALAGTPLEAVLPLKASPRIAERKPTLALVLVIDKSKSMLDDNRLELAKRAASQTVDELAADDKVGVLAFGTENDWVTEIVPVGDKAELKRRIATLEAEGQTDMYPALEKAYLALELADADRRHAIVLTDGVSTPGDFGKIAARMAEAGITVSTVSISPGAEQQILKDISRIAGGQHYHCDDAADIVSILVRDTRRVETAAVEFAPIVHQALPGLDVSGAPPLLGYAPTSPHGGAHLLLRTEGGDPLLAWRRHGRGMTIAFPADVKDRFAARWQTWSGFDPFWTRVLSYARRRSWDEFRVSITREGRRATVALDLLDSPPDMAPPMASIQAYDAAGSPAARPLRLPMARTAPNRFAAEFPLSLGGIYSATVEFIAEDGQPKRETVGLAFDYDDEFRLGPADESLLRNVVQQTGGRFAPSPRDVAAGKIEPRSTPTALWPYFVLAAAVLLALEVLVRRLPQMLGT
jgi:Mg-chelatase subunit ChlD